MSSRAVKSPQNGPRNAAFPNLETHEKAVIVESGNRQPHRARESHRLLE